MLSLSVRPLVFIVAVFWVFALAANLSLAGDTLVLFDLPDTIECTDVTPQNFAANHPDLKVIEAKLRISARIPEGKETDLVDFLYMITSAGMRMKIQDYLPNTTLESTVQGDQIEIADTSESSSATAEDAHINYKVLGLGGAANQGSKKTESSKYKQIAPKALVVASGTTNREHGVFFKLEPSKGTSLEGAKTFTFLAIVPKGWRGDWCIVSCAARAKKKSLFSTTVFVAGVEQAHIGMYLSGDREASHRAEQLCEIQQVNESLLTTPSASHENGLVEAMHAATNPENLFGYAWLHSVFTGKAKSEGTDEPNGGSPDAADVEQRKAEVHKEMLDVQERLKHLSGSEP